MLCEPRGGGSPTCVWNAAAVAAANPNDTIVVAPGTYNEFDITLGKSLTIQGAGPGTTIVDAQHNDARIFWVSGAGTTVAISGIGIQNGRIYSATFDAFGGGAEECYVC